MAASVTSKLRSLTDRCKSSRSGRRFARRSRSIGWWVEAATVIRRCPFFVHSANEPSPIPNLRAPMGGLHVEHLRRVLARFIVRSKININADSEPILAVAQINSIGPGRNDARLPHATRPSDNMTAIRQTAAFGLLVEQLIYAEHTPENAPSRRSDISRPAVR
jgi:hypothetical protein